MKGSFGWRTVLGLTAGLLLAAGAASADQPAGASPEVVTLDQVVAGARAAAPGLRLAAVAVDTARAGLTQTQAVNGLSLAGSGGYFHQGNLPGISSSSTGAASAAGSSAGAAGINGENLQGGLTLSGPATSVDLAAQHSIAESGANDQVSSISLSASQTVFDGYPGGRATAAVQQATYAFRAAQVAYDASLKSLIYQVKQAYYTLLGDQNTVLIRQATVKQAEQNLAYYRGLFDAKRATQLDLLQNQVALTQAELDLRSAENTVEVDRKSLSLAVGWPLDRRYTVANTPLPEMPALQTEEALKTAFQNRSELLTLELNIAAANVNLALQKSQAFPVVSVNGSLGLAQNWTANSNEGNSFTVGARVELPVLDGGLRSAQVQQASDQVASYKVQQDQEGQSITIAVEKALFDLRDARDRLDLAGQSVKAAQGQYDLQKARYAVGLNTTLDVLTAFSALTSAQVGLEQSKNSYALAVLNLDNVMGL